MRNYGVITAAAVMVFSAVAMGQQQGTPAEQEARFEAYFKERDTNGDGKWSQEEATAGQEGQRLEFSKKFFTMMDENKDVSVTWDEAKAFGVKMREAQTKADEWFNGADTNTDEKVSLTEATAKASSEDEKTHISGIFGKVDADKDGFISKGELRRGVFMVLAGDIKIS